jgi:hypothetical protein
MWGFNMISLSHIFEISEKLINKIQQSRVKNRQQAYSQMKFTNELEKQERNDFHRIPALKEKLQARNMINHANSKLNNARIERNRV